MINVTNLISVGSNTPASSYLTSSISPGANKLILVAVGSKINLSIPNTPTVSGAGMTWTQVGDRAKTDAQRTRVTLFRALSSSPGVGGLTISWGGQTQERFTVLVAEFTGVIRTGTNGADAIVQSATAQTVGANAESTTSLSISLAALSHPRNASYGTFNGIDGAITPGSGYTEIAEADTDQTNHQHQFKAPGQTTVNWTFSAMYGTGIAVELKAAPAQAGFLSLL